MDTIQSLPRTVRFGLLVALAVAVLVPVIRAVPALGQSGVMRPVIVAVPDVFPEEKVPGEPRDNVVSVILRAPGQTDIVVLNGEYATPAGLAAAINGLKRSRVAMANPERGTLLVLRTASPPRSRRALGTMVAALAKIRAQPPSRVGDIGRGRWFEFPAKDLGM
ncbi:MAG TPA: hypothetical protein VF188_17645 [Longimicrobiales bacterium]